VNKRKKLMTKQLKRESQRKGTLPKKIKMRKKRKMGKML
jgi:hypothetical protein